MQLQEKNVKMAFLTILVGKKKRFFFFFFLGGGVLWGRFKNIIKKKKLKR